MCFYFAVLGFANGLQTMPVPEDDQFRKEYFNKMLSNIQFEPLSHQFQNKAMHSIFAQHFCRPEEFLCPCSYSRVMGLLVPLDIFCCCGYYPQASCSHVLPTDSFLICLILWARFDTTCIFLGALHSIQVFLIKPCVYPDFGF